jgi:hypothetical protein
MTRFEEILQEHDISPDYPLFDGYAPKAIESLIEKIIELEWYRTYYVNDVNVRLKNILEDCDNSPLIAAHARPYLKKLWLQINKKGE